jgi:uncharacterized membrane protein
MDAFHDLLMFLGSTVCHQLAERSYFYDGVQMPLCARCIGIHFGFVLSTAFLLIGPRKYASKLPSTKQLAVLVSIMAFYFLDAGLSYSNISTSDDLRRTLSGLALGIPLPFLLISLLNLLARPSKSSTSVFERSWDWLALPGLYAFGLAAILLAERSGLVFYSVSTIGVAGVFVFFTSVFSTITLIAFEKSSLEPRYKVAAAGVLAFVVLMALAALHIAFPTT